MTQVSPLPTRVVDVNLQGGNPILYSSQPGEAGQYATLIYCWGKGNALKTTRETYAENSRGFSLASCPKTLKDAIMITRQLQIQYIWIDAVCILQDVKRIGRESPQTWQTSINSRS